MEEQRISKEAEEYLEAIYRLEETHGVARTMGLVRMLGVAPGSVTNTIEHLERHGLVVHTPYRGVRLTAKGRRVALGVVRRHRLAERLLTDFLKIKWSDVHELACKLEHAMVDAVTQPTEKALGYPKVCPHGNPIPTVDGTIERENDIVSLAQIETDIEGIIVKITDEEQEKLRLLAKLGLKPGTRVKVVQKTVQKVKISSRRGAHVLDKCIAATVWIKVLRGGKKSE
jgi:DtxR family Mn-dependent transcriptional regulator